MDLENNMQSEDAVTHLIDKLYNDILMMRFECMELRVKKSPVLEEKLEKVANLEDDFQNLLKTHTQYLRFKKATGHTSKNHSKEMISKIREIENNVGSIVSLVPKN